MKRILLSSVLGCMLVGSAQANIIENSKNFLGGVLNTGKVTLLTGALSFFLIDFCIRECIEDPVFLSSEGISLGETPETICWGIMTGAAASPLLKALHQGFPKNINKMTLAGSLTASGIMAAYLGKKTFESWKKALTESKKPFTK
ncbi:MAG: hypothetical protein WD055_00895 [Candidatus Dependentiae bacterium]